MSNTYAHVDAVISAVRTGLLEWTSGLIAASGTPVEIAGGIPGEGGPTLVLLPYQIMPESQPGTPTITLMPLSPNANRDALPGPWRTLAHGMTTVLVEQFPKRERSAPGIGPIHPNPPIDQLPAPIRAWYEANPTWHQGGNGSLPQINWRQPFSLVLRFGALVVDPSEESEHLHDLRLRALAVFAAGIRIERYFGVALPPAPVPDDLRTLLLAFAESAPEPLRTEMLEATEGVLQPGDTAIGLTPHHELTDEEIALVMGTLELPMQPVVVFAIRLALGAGPVLATGALPHLGSVTTGSRA